MVLIKPYDKCQMHELQLRKLGLPGRSCDGAQQDLARQSSVACAYNPTC